MLTFKQPLALLLLALLLSGCAREKDLLDEQARQYCAKDGGVKTYEQVRLPASSFDGYGVVNVPIASLSKPSDPFYYEWGITYYKKGNPEMWRNHFRLYRRSDGKILGEAIGYSRRGGDFPGPWHDSSFGCPEDSDISILKKLVFLRAE